MVKEKKPRQKWSRRKKIWLSVLFVFLAFIVSVGLQFGYNMLFVGPVGDVKIADNADEAMKILLRDAPNLPDSYFQDQNQISSDLAGSIEEINDRNDCADFTASAVMRVYLENKNRMLAANKDEIKQCLTQFKYWPAEKDSREDGMCFWSENHLIMFAVTDYLAGNEWPDANFADGRKGNEHAEMAKNRINAWMELRYSYGFGEYYSNNYYPEDIGPMSNFIQFSSDQEMVNRMKIIMDLIFYDIASQSYKYTGDNGKTYYAFMSAGGRMYFDNKASDDTGNRLRNYVDFILGTGSTDYETWGATFFNCFKHMYRAKDEKNEPYYQVPEVIKAIFDDPSKEQLVKASSGLDVEELKNEGLVGMEDKQIMAQFGEEAFSNPEVIDNSIAFMNKWGLFRNEFLNDFKMVNLYPLVWTHTLGALAKTLHPATDGKAVQRGNVYTYQTPYYTLSTNQGYQPGEFGDQQQMSLATLGNDLSVFNVQPMRISTRENYWVGEGRMPYAVQEKNIVLSLHTIPSKPGALEPHIVPFSHVYFPAGLFSETDLTHLSEGFAFGRKNNTYIMVRAISDDGGSLAYKNSMDGVSEDDLAKDRSKIKSSVKALIEATGDLRYDLIFKGGNKHLIITELSSVEQDGSFANFINRLLQNQAKLDPSDFSVEYTSGGTALKAIYDQSFTVNGVKQNLQYDRYESPYVQNGKTERKAKEIVFSFNLKKLSLNYEDNRREETL